MLVLYLWYLWEFFLSLFSPTCLYTFHLFFHGFFHGRNSQCPGVLDGTEGGGDIWCCLHFAQPNREQDTRPGIYSNTLRRRGPREHICWPHCECSRPAYLPVIDFEFQVQGLKKQNVYRDKVIFTIMMIQNYPHL